MARKQTSHQRRAVDRGVFNQKVFFGMTFNEPPRRPFMGTGVRGNRRLSDWPWPYLVHRVKSCEPIPCPPFETMKVVVTD